MGDPATVRASIERWRESSDDVLRSLRERCEFDPGRWVSSDALYTAFNEWLAGRTLPEKPRALVGLAFPSD